MRNDEEGRSCKTHYTDSEDSDLTADDGRKLYYRPCLVLAAPRKSHEYQNHT